MELRIGLLKLTLSRRRIHHAACTAMGLTSMMPILT